MNDNGHFTACKGQESKKHSHEKKKKKKKTGVLMSIFLPFSHTTQLICLKIFSKHNKKLFSSMRLGA